MFIKKYWGQAVEIDGKVWTTKVSKPIYGSTLALNEKLLKAAIANQAQLVVISGNMKALIKPSDWIKTGKRMEKVFRDPYNPMVLYQNSLGGDSVSKKESRRKPIPTVKGQVALFEF